MATGEAHRIPIPQLHQPQHHATFPSVAANSATGPDNPIRCRRQKRHAFVQTTNVVALNRYGSFTDDRYRSVCVNHPRRHPLLLPLRPTAIPRQQRRLPARSLEPRLRPPPRRQATRRRCGDDQGNGPLRLGVALLAGDGQGGG